MREDNSSEARSVQLANMYANPNCSGLQGSVILGEGNGTSKDGKSGQLVDPKIAGVTVTKREMA